jgi:hypothetical protein
MSIHIAKSLGRALAHRLALPLVLLTSLGCDHDFAQLSVGRDAAPSVQAQRGTRNPVIQWSSIAAVLMVDPGPIIDSRAYAILHTAIHDAVNGVERRFEPYAAKLSSPRASLDAAVATAARDVLVTLSPSTREKIEAEYASALAEIPDGPAKTEGVSLGRESARVNLARRAGDSIPVGPWPPVSGPITQPVYVPNGTPGDYAFTPPFDKPPLGPMALFPGWGRLRPFAVGRTRYPLRGPDALESREYARDVEHVKSVGSLNSRTRTADQAEIAKFWFEDFPVLVQIANSVLKQQGVDAWDAARTLALMHLAIADAGIACFEAKYRFRFWRPYTAIRHASEDGNPRTAPDTTWVPLLWTSPDVLPPTFLIPPIPEYPSGAATVASAAAEVLARLLGDHQRFEATSRFLPGVTRRFSSFTQAAEEAGLSRVYGGIHFPSAVTDGARLGRSVGRDVSRLLPPVRR